MRHVHSTLRLPSLAVIVALIAAACGGGAGARVATPAATPAATPPGGSAQPPRPAQPTEVPQTDPTPPPPPKGVLAGKVTAFSTDAPIARARVILSADTKVLPHPRVLLTDADGTFRFTDLPATNTYLLTVTKSGYAPRAFGEAPPAVPPTLITLGQDEVKTDVVVKLSEQVSIAGRVLDEDGTPFAGALVEAMRAMFDGDRRTLVTVSEAVTDDRGEFRLVGLPPGQYYLSAFDPAFLDVGDKDGQLFYSPTFYPGVVFPDEATRITLDPGVPSERLEFKLRIIRPSRLLGSISTPVEGLGVAKPLIAAAVNLSPLRNDQFSLFTFSEPTMEPGGGFLFANVPPGRYRIQARGETEREGVTRFQVFTIEIAGVDKRDAHMVLSQGALVSGRVEWETTSGRIPDRTGIIVHMPMEDGNEFGEAGNGYLQPDDTWLIRGVMAGKHYFRMGGLPPGWTMKRVEYQGADITDVARSFNYDEEVTGFTIVLTDRASVVRGFVTPQGRDDVQSYAVVVFPVSALHWRPHSRYIQLTYPDELGRYEIRGLPPGQYQAVATRAVDESDLGNPQFFDRISRQAGVTPPFEITDRGVKRVDITPITRSGIR